MKNINSTKLILASDGGTIGTTLSGDSQTNQRVLMIHGNPGSRAHFGELAPLLSSSYQVLCVDLPGFGDSSLAERSQSKELSLDRLSDAMLEAADAFGWDNFFVVGHSHGGGVAQLLASKYPERIRGIVLLSSLGFPAHLNYRLLSLPGVRILFAALASFFVPPHGGRQSNGYSNKYCSRLIRRSIHHTLMY